MTAKKANLALITILLIMCLAMLVGARLATSSLSGKSQRLINLQLEQASLASEQAQLATAKSEIKKYAPLASIAGSIVPQDKDQAEAVREIVAIAGASNINLSSISFPSSSLGSTPTASSTAKINLSQLTAVKGLSGVYELPITIISNENQPISFSQFIGFLKQLENNRRTAQVTNVALTPNDKNPGVLSFSLNVNEYIKP